MKKQSAKQSSSLSKTQISLIARFAALKAHCNPAFHKLYKRSAQERKETVAAYNTALAKAPAFIRSRFERI